MEIFFVEYTDADGLGQEWPTKGYTTETACETFIESLPYEQQMTAVVQYYDPFED
jgi:hypothetical protein